MKRPENPVIDVMRIIFMNSARHQQGPFLADSSAPNQIHHQTEAATHSNPSLAAHASKSTVVRETTPRALSANDKTEPILERQRSRLGTGLNKDIGIDIDHLDALLLALALRKILDCREGLFEDVHPADVLRHERENR